VEAALSLQNEEARQQVLTMLQVRRVVALAGADTMDDARDTGH
jgi:hypothetical protein